MRNRNRILNMVMVAVLFLAIGFGIGRYDWSNENVDVVHDVPPMSEVFVGIDETLERLATLSMQQQAEYLTQQHPNLGNNVIYWLRRDGHLSRDVVVDNVDFRFGSLENVSAESGDGDMRRGHFENQIVAVVRYANGGSRKLILRCMNGLTVDANQLMAMNVVGGQVPVEQFTIARGEGLTHHVGFLTAIDIAERHGLPVFRGRHMTSANRIGYEEARSLEFETDVIQVTVYVEPGDEFDLQRDIYTQARRS